MHLRDVEAPDLVANLEQPATYKEKGTAAQQRLSPFFVPSLKTASCGYSSSGGMRSTWPG